MRLADHIAIDRVLSAQRVAQISDGLLGDDAWLWRALARQRLRALGTARPAFGLVHHELDERDELMRLLADDAARSGPMAEQIEGDA